MQQASTGIKGCAHVAARVWVLKALLPLVAVAEQARRLTAHIGVWSLLNLHVFFSSVLCLRDKPRLDPVMLVALHAFARCPFLARVFFFVARMGAPKGTKKPV